MNDLTLKAEQEILDVSKTPKKYKRRFGDRKDGRRLRTLDPLTTVAPF